METYVGPPPDGSNTPLSKERVRDALRAQGLWVVSEAEELEQLDRRGRWSVRFEGTSARLDFQVEKQSLVFATVEQSMFEESSLPDLVFEALEGVGWAVDQESIG